MVRIWRFHCRGPGSVPGRGIEIPQDTRPGGGCEEEPKTLPNIFLTKKKQKQKTKQH